MQFLERLFYILFPLAALKGTPWEKQWASHEKENFRNNAVVFFAITFVGYILHYYTVDRAEGLSPSTLWFQYRYGMGLVSLLCFLTYLNLKKINLKNYRLPAIIAGALFVYFQTRTIIWYPKIPYLYSFAFVFVCVTVLSTSILKSTLLGILYFSFIVPSLQESGLSNALIFSACFFTLAIIIIARSKYLIDLKYFIETQKNILQQKKFIESNIEFTNQIRAFLPGEISRRLTDFIQEKRMNVIQAIDEVLRPKQTKVACLFSDIRGFTKSSEDLKGWVSEAMYPNVKASTLAVERFKGIPRKVGDLLFAYFDYEEIEESIQMALKSAVEISKINAQLNSTLSDDLKIKRYILLSYGDAIVGNLSGYDVSIEITAIGRPVNYLSRIDEATKSENLRNILESGDIILSEEFHSAALTLFPKLKFIELDLNKLNVKIRDFENSHKLFIYRVNHNSYSKDHFEEAA